MRYYLLSYFSVYNNITIDSILSGCDIASDRKLLISVPGTDYSDTSLERISRDQVILCLRVNIESTTESDQRVFSQMPYRRILPYRRVPWSGVPLYIEMLF